MNVRSQIKERMPTQRRTKLQQKWRQQQRAQQSAASMSKAPNLGIGRIMALPTPTRIGRSPTTGTAGGPPGATPGILVPGLTGAGNGIIKTTVDVGGGTGMEVAVQSVPHGRVPLGLGNNAGTKGTIAKALGCRP